MTQISHLRLALVNGILTLTLVLLLPIISLVVLPLLGWREIVKFLSKVFCKNHGKMLHSMANLFAIEYPSMYQQKTVGTLYVTVAFKGHVTIAEILARCREILQEKCVDDPTQLRNPELQQIIVKWMGYYFWQWDKQFNVEDHVKMYDGPGKIQIETEEDLNPIYRQITTKPFPPGKSPWECLVWHHALSQNGENRTVLIVRGHHALCDGFGFMKGILGDAQVQKIQASLDRQNKEGNKKKENSATLFFRNLSLIWRVPIDLIGNRGNYDDIHEWNFPKEKLTGNLSTTKSGVIPIKLIKEIKQIYGTTFQTIIQAAFAGGLRNFMMEKNVTIPTKFSCFLALPIKGHPAKMRNFSTAVFTSLPVGVADVKDRIRIIEGNVQKLRRSTVPMTNFIISRMWGCLPPSLMVALDAAHSPTCVLSNFPGPPEQVEICHGRPVDMLHFGAGIMKRIGISMNCLSYNGHIRIGVSVDDAVSPNQEFVNQLAQKIVEELHVMKSTEIV